MEQQSDGQLSVDLASVRTRVQNWRSVRRIGTRMPEDLWTEAVLLARKHGPFAIAKGLSVNCGTLKGRMERPAEPVVVGPVRPADFIELPPARFDDSPGLPVTVVEVMETDGAKMVIRLPANGSLDLVGLVAAFRRRCA